MRALARRVGQGWAGYLLRLSRIGGCFTFLDHGGVSGTASNICPAENVGRMECRPSMISLLSYASYALYVTYFMFTEGGVKVLAHFMLPAAAFAIANQVGNPPERHERLGSSILIVAGIGYTFIIVRQ